ncbi:MAG: NUDIX hydrolase [Acidobacteriota bacterium]|nr:NUDIX hydrolase [Acidobacteriota bacterium]
MRQNPNIIVADRRDVYRGRIFRVEVDRVTLPSGHTLDMEMVRHPGSVVLLPIPAPGHLVMIRQYRYAIGKYIWELPAGSLKPGEDPDSAAARECEEEIGLRPRSLERLQAFYPTPGFCDELMIYYRCTDLVPPTPDSTARKDDDEDIEPRTFTVAEARALIDRGDIVDLKTVAGLSLI